MFNGRSWSIIRACDDETGLFADLPITRLSRLRLAPTITRPTHMGADSDIAWVVAEDLHIVPARHLNAAQVDLVARDYG